MTVRERLLAIKLLEKQQKDPHYAEKLGIRVNMAEKATKNRETGGKLCLNY